MKSPRFVQKVPVPARARVSCGFEHIDFADAYRAILPSGHPAGVDDVARSIFDRTPRWTRALLRVRNAMVRPFGLRVKAGPEPISRQGVIRPGQRVGTFRVHARTEEEVLMGEDDRHLDFRVSVLLVDDGAGRGVVVTTTVQFHGWPGRAYFALVRPFHRLIVPAVMRTNLRADRGG
jgi:hypothetical protein